MKTSKLNLDENITCNRLLLFY